MMTVYFLLTNPKTDVGRAEVNAAYFALKNMGNRIVRAVPPDRLAELEFTPDDVIVCHHPCEELSPFLKNVKTQDALKKAVENGTGIVLTLTAALLPYVMGIESLKPTLLEHGRWRKETGHFAFRGYMAFAEHPLFNSVHRLRNLVHVWTPQSGEPFWRTVYRGKAPERVIARGCRYLSQMDDEACCWEYRLGKGKMVCAGGYLYYNARRNYQTHQSKAFLENCISYVSDGKSDPDSKLYWPPAEVGIEEKSQKESLYLPEIDLKYPPERYFQRPGLPSLPANTGNNFYSSAGRRVLLLGKEGEKIGEIWSYPVRLLKDLVWAIKPGGKGDIPQKAMYQRSTIYPDAVHQIYEYNAYGIREQVGTSIFKPAAFLQLETVAERDFSFSLSFTSDLAMMWPMPRSATGKIFYKYEKGKRIIKLKAGGTGAWCVIGLDKKPNDVRFIDAGTEDYSCVRIEIDFPLMQAGMHYFSLAVLGGTECMDVPHYDSSLNINAIADIDRSADHYRTLQQNLFEARTPDTVINEGAHWAQLKMESFRAVTPGLGRGLTAGLAISGEDWMATRPGYAWYFGRDSMWTSLSLLTLGQWNAVSDALRLLTDYQAVDGKIFHELSPSGYAHYDSADANLLLLIVAERYLAWTGDDQTISHIRPTLKKALDFSFYVDRDGDGLTENTGVGHGWIEGGKLFGAHVTFYLAGLWLQALKAAKVLFRGDGDEAFRMKIERTYNKVDKLIRTLFWDNSRETYYYGMNSDETMVSADTIMPAAVILFGDTDPDMDEKFLYRTSGPDIITDWGARMISEQDERFNPTGYHIGSVWPLYTGWLGLAMYKRGRFLQGYELLLGGFSSYADFSAGCFSEVLRGDVYEEIGVCPQQAWSASMLLWLLTKGMLGMEAQSDGSLMLAPVFPPHWQEAEFSNIRWADGQIGLSFRRTGENFTYTLRNLKQGTRLTFSPRFPAGSLIKATTFDGTSIQPDVDIMDRKSQVHIPICGLSGSIEIKIQLDRFISPLPEMKKPSPGKPSIGYRILNWEIGPDLLWVELMGRSGTTNELIIIDPGDFVDISDREVKVEGERKINTFKFSSGTDLYARTTLQFGLKSPA